MAAKNTNVPCFSASRISKSRCGYSGPLNEGPNLLSGCKSTDCFYPDFVARRKMDASVVEYKGAHLWTNDDSKEKRAVGELWATRSKGKCLFVMPNGPLCGNIESHCWAMTT